MNLGYQPSEPFWCHDTASSPSGKSVGAEIMNRKRNMQFYKIPQFQLTNLSHAVQHWGCFDELKISHLFSQTTTPLH